MFPIRNSEAVLNFLKKPKKTLRKSEETSLNKSEINRANLKRPDKCKRGVAKSDGICIFIMIFKEFQSVSKSS